jgi:hypothetical protein
VANYFLRRMNMKTAEALLPLCAKKDMFLIKYAVCFRKGNGVWSVNNGYMKSNGLF